MSWFLLHVWGDTIDVIPFKQTSKTMDAKANYCIGFGPGGTPIYKVFGMLVGDFENDP